MTVTITTTTVTITIIVKTISSKKLFLFFLVAPAVRRVRTLARVTVEPPLSVNLNQVNKKLNVYNKSKKAKCF